MYRLASRATALFTALASCPASLAMCRLEEGKIVGFIGKKRKNKVCGMTSVISLPMGDEVKVTQKGDD